MELEELINAYLTCRDNKKRTVDMMHFELHAERNLIRLHEDFENRDLVPLLYSFIRSTPRWREVNACKAEGKILQTYFDIRVRPLVEETLTNRTFNNRIGYGPDVAVNCLLNDIFEVSNGFTKDCWIFFRDIKAFFPSADLNRSYDDYRRLIEASPYNEDIKDDLLYILLRTTWSYPSLNARLKSPIHLWREHIPRYKSVIFNRDFDHGAALGNQHWQVAQNFDLRDYDKWQVDTCGVRYGRFVDDMWWVFADKAQGLAHVAASERKLKEEYGYTMHPNKRYCQHYTKGGKFISTPFKLNRVYVNNSLVNRVKNKIRYWNRHISPNNIRSFISSINSYLGKMKRVNAYSIIRCLLEKISRGWWKMCFFNEERKCIQPNPEYRENPNFTIKYNFTIHLKDEKRRNHFASGFTPYDASRAS